MSHPTEHIADAHQLQSDAEIHLFEIETVDGVTVNLKSDNTVTWRGRTYEGTPLAFKPGRKSSQTSSDRATIIIGDENISLLPVKPLIFDKALDGAIITHRIVLRAHIENNQNISFSQRYRVKQVAEYSRSSLTLELSKWVDAMGFRFPVRQYLPPAFPTVQL
jgi:phage-related protein